MPTATVNSKGGITIPVAVRVALGLDSGSRVEFVEMGNGQYAFIAAAGTVKSLKGMLRKSDVTVSIEQMNQVIARRGIGPQ